MILCGVVIFSMTCIAEESLEYQGGCYIAISETDRKLLNRALRWKTALEEVNQKTIQTSVQDVQKSIHNNPYIHYYMTSDKKSGNPSGHDDYDDKTKKQEKLLKQTQREVRMIAASFLVYSFSSPSKPFPDFNHVEIENY